LVENHDASRTHVGVLTNWLAQSREESQESTDCAASKEPSSHTTSACQSATSAEGRGQKRSVIGAHAIRQVNVKQTLIVTAETVKRQRRCGRTGCNA
jgi:hypothetical protein